MASARLRANGYRVSVIGDGNSGAIVNKQAPGPGEKLKRGARVRLVSESSDKSFEVMPDLTGLSIRQATCWLLEYGIDIKVEGNGIVLKQYPKTGKAVTEIVTLYGG